MEDGSFYENSKLIFFAARGIETVEKIPPVYAATQRKTAVSAYIFSIVKNLSLVRVI